MARRICRDDGNSAKITVDEWFAEWLAEYKKPIVKSGTVLSYQTSYHAHILAILGNVPLAEVTPTHIRRLLNAMAEHGYKDATIALAYAMLSGLFKTAYLAEKIDKNPMERVMRPRGGEQQERRVFTRKEQELFLCYAAQSPFSDFFRLALYTGMRGGELSGLLWEDVDMKNRIIHVRHARKRDGTMDTPKTKSSVRDIPLMPQAYELLCTKKGDEIPKNPVLTAAGEPLRYYHIRNEIHRILARMKADGITFVPFTPHCLRHTFATRAIEAGMQPQVLKSILGHANLAITMDLYAHVLSDAKREAINSIAGAF